MSLVLFFGSWSLVGQVIDTGCHVDHIRLPKPLFLQHTTFFVFVLAPKTLQPIPIEHVYRTSLFHDSGMCLHNCPLDVIF